MSVVGRTDRLETAGRTAGSSVGQDGPGRIVAHGTAIAEDDARLRSLLDRIENIPVQGYDARRCVIYWNRASAEVYGYTREEALGRRLEDLIIPETIREGVVQAVDAWLAGGAEIPSGELVLRDRRGQDVPVYSSHIMHVTADGEREMYCIDVDLRDLKRSEAERARLAEEKAALEKQYLQAQKLEAVGQLAGGVAHDFNNLLQIINGYAALAIADLPADHPAAASLAQVRRAGESASRLADQLLSISRKRPLDIDVLDPNLFIAELLEMLRRVIGDGIRIAYHPRSQTGTILVDRCSLEQVLLNLCVNARDAMPGGGVLTLATEDVVFDAKACRGHVWAQPGPYVRIDVGDTGCGMPPAVAERIFEPFFTTKPLGRGTGLGLSAVQGLVGQHGGAVFCRSELGRGTVFQVYLPAGKADRTSGLDVVPPPDPDQP